MRLLYILLFLSLISCSSLDEKENKTYNYDLFLYTPKKRVIKRNFIVAKIEKNDSLIFNEINYIFTSKDTINYTYKKDNNSWLEIVKNSNDSIEIKRAISSNQSIEYKYRTTIARKGLSVIDDEFQELQGLFYYESCKKYDSILNQKTLNCVCYDYVYPKLSFFNAEENRLIFSYGNVGFDNSFYNYILVETRYSDSISNLNYSDLLYSEKGLFYNLPIPPPPPAIISTLDSLSLH